MNNDLITFAIVINTCAESIFEKMYSGLYASLLVISVTENGVVNYYETSNEGAPTHYDFSNITTLAEQARLSSQEKFLFNTDPNVQESYERAFAKSGYDFAITRILEQYDFYHEYKFYVSHCILISEKKERVYVALKLNKKVHNEIYKLPIENNISRLHLFPTLVDAVVYGFFKELEKSVAYDDSGFSTADINPEEVLKNSATSFLCTVTSRMRMGDGLWGLDKKLNDISFLEYEKKSLCKGGFVFTYKDNPVINWKVKFQNPPYLSESRKIRKLLEISTDTLFLISDATFVYGLGVIGSDYNPQLGELYKVKFIEKYKWVLLHDEKPVLYYHFNMPSLPRSFISREYFSEKYERILGKNDAQANLFYNLLLNVIQEHSGTILVVSEKAKNESKRLGKQSTPIEPMQLNEENIRCITKIDGAVISDTNGICYAIGAILDGIAVSDKGDSMRGSRYNSSIRYYYSQKNRKVKLLVIVISDDGMVDIIPDLRPRKKKEFIENLVIQAKNLSEMGVVDVGEYNHLLSIIMDNKFYFSEANCNLVNHCFSVMGNKTEPKNCAKLVFRNLTPDKEFSEDEYLE